MTPFSNKSFFARKLTEFKHSLSYIDALPQLTLLGALVGIATGGIIVVFRLLIDIPLNILLPTHNENFESLALMTRLLFVILGATALFVLLKSVSEKSREVSIAHVLDRMHNHQSKLPLKNWCVQFLGAAIALISGQSVGREGPVVHLGAGASSQLGQWLHLPNNSIHTLVGCGVAAAISASFDTPMAGVIFAMEILALEYTIVGFVPVILASVMGMVISKAIFGQGNFISFTDTNIHSLFEIPLMVVVGLFIAVCAGIYIRLNIFALKFKHYPLSARITCATALTCLAIIWVPEVMGQGYDTVNAAIDGKLFIGTLALIAVVKLLLTPVVIGLGIPGGLIGPLLVIGACVGGAIGYLASSLFPDLGAHPHFYVLMGMAGMMAATLNAPLTALVTVLELSYNPHIIFPAMMVIVIACVTTRQLFNVQNIFVEQLKHSGRSLDFGPAKQALRRAGVRSVMDTRFVICEQIISHTDTTSLLSHHPKWLVITDENKRYCDAMLAADLANYLNANEASITHDDKINLLEIPSRIFRIDAIHESASLYEAMQSFNEKSTELLYVSGASTAYTSDIKGILTLESIENYYKPEEFRSAVG